MSLYTPAGIGAADLDVAGAPYLGGEWAVYLTTVAAISVGEIAVTGPSAATLTVYPGAQIPNDDAQVFPMLGYRGGSGATALVVVTSNETIYATFAPPARSANQRFGFERGYARDMDNGSGSEEPMTQLPISASVTNGVAGSRFGLVSLPDLASYTLIGCVRDFDFNTKSRMAKGVDCGMEADAFVKRGKTQAGEITIGDKLKGFAEGLARFDGLKCTLMAVGIKDGQVIGDRLVFTQFVPTSKHKLPEGDGEANSDAIGKFVEHLMFVAP